MNRFIWQKSLKMKTTDIFEQLKAPFPPEKISWRVGSTKKDKSSGLALAYIDARDVMQRLDDVVGGGGWQVRYSHADKKTICELSLLVPAYDYNDTNRREWITKSNGAGDSDIEAEKGAISDAFKRAAVLWGIGRYLYELPNVWVDLDTYTNAKGDIQVRGISKGQEWKMTKALNGVAHYDETENESQVPASKPEDESQVVAPKKILTLSDAQYQKVNGSIQLISSMNTENQIEWLNNEDNYKMLEWLKKAQHPLYREFVALGVEVEDASAST